MLSRSNGGVIGTPNSTTVVNGSGVYSPSDNANAQNTLTPVGQETPWPVANDVDPYRHLVNIHFGDAISSTNLFSDKSPNAWDQYINVGTQYNGISPMLTSYNPNTAYHSGSFNCSEYLAIPDSAALKLGTGNFCIEGWFYSGRQSIGSSASTHYIISRAGSTTTGWAVALVNNTTLTFFDTATSLASSVTSTPFTWNHFAVVRTSTGTGGLALYLNGNLVATGTSATNFNEACPMYIGLNRTVVQDSTSWNGYLTDIRISSSTTFGPITAPLVSDANTKFLWSMLTKDYTLATWVKTTSALPLRYPIAPFADTDTSNCFSYTLAADWRRSIVVLDSYSTGNTSLRFGGAFTIECWFFPNSATSNSLITKGSSTTTGWELYANGSPTAAGVTFVDGGTARTFTASNMMPYCWHHIAVVRSGLGANQTTIYVDGVAIGSFTCSTSFNLNDNVRLGWPKTAGVAVLTGLICNVHLSNVARYSGTFTPTCPAVADANSVLLLLTTKDSVGVFTVNQYGTAKSVFYNPYSTRQIGGPNHTTGWCFFENGTVSAGYYITANSNFQFTGDFSVECSANMRYAFYPDGFRTIFDTRSNTSSSTDTGWSLMINDYGHVQFMAQGTASLLTSRTRAQAQEWIHIVVQRIGSVLSLYINGTLEDQIAYSATLGVAGTQVKLLGHTEQYGSPFYGYVAGIRINKDTPAYLGTNGSTPDFIPKQFEAPKEVAGTVFLTAVGPILKDYANPAVVNDFQVTDGNGNLFIAPLSPWTKEFDPNNFASGFGWDGANQYVEWEHHNNGGACKKYALFGTTYVPWTMELWAYVPPETKSTITGYDILSTATVDTQCGFSLTLEYDGTTGGYQQVSLRQYSASSGVSNIYKTPTGVLRMAGYNYIAVVNDTVNVAIFVNGVRASLTPCKPMGSGSYPYQTNALTVGGASRATISDVRMSTVARYPTAGLTMPIPTGPFTPDADTYAYFLNKTQIPETTGRAYSYQTGSPNVSYTVKKFGKGSYRFKQSDASSVNYTDYLEFRGSTMVADYQATSVRVADFTVEMWLSWSSNGATPLARPTGGNAFYQFENIKCYTDAASKYVFSWGTYVVTTNITVSGSNIFDHIAIVRRNMVYRFYVNGVQAAVIELSNTDTTTARNTEDITAAYQLHVLGCLNTRVNATAWQGNMQDFRFTAIARYTTNVINNVPTMVHVADVNVPALPTGLFPLK